MLTGYYMLQETRVAPTPDPAERGTRWPSRLAAAVGRLHPALGREAGKLHP